MLTLSSVLAFFTLLVISSAVFFASKRLKIPYTVLLVLVGLILVPIVKFPMFAPVFGFLDDMTLTPEMLFYVFLPILIFESAFNMNIRRMVDSAWSITLLAVVGLLISTAVIASALYFLLPLIGLEIPFIIALLFGAIISSTDPVAVLALFKDYGAPKRLSLIFEGESLFNDGTAVALFLVILAVAESGFNGAETVFDGVLMFAVMVLSGIVIGLVMAALFSRALRYTKSNEFVSVTLLIISAHLVFVISESISQHGLFGLHFHVSPIIATTVASLFLGNYARHILSPKMGDYLGKSIEHLAFVANSLVFLLAGMLFASTQVDLRVLWLPILVTIIIVAAARAVAVFAVTRPLNRAKLEAAIPPSWETLLAWGSLRGALAIIIVMLIPEDFTVAGWTYEFTPRELLLSLTIGCILATLFIKALTIGPLMRKLDITASNPLDDAHSADLGVYYLLTEQSRFATQKTRGFVRDGEYLELKDTLSMQLKAAYATRDRLIDLHGMKLFEHSLRLTAIDIEDHYLEQLYSNGEVSERVYRMIKGKLNLQKEKIESHESDQIDPSAHTDRKDIFDRLVNFIQAPFEKNTSAHSPKFQLQYYRAQMIMARKAQKTLETMQTQYDTPVFMPAVYAKVDALYDKYRNQSSSKMDTVLARHSDELAEYLSELAHKSLHASGGRALEFLRYRGIVSEENSHEIEHKFSS